MKLSNRTHTNNYPWKSSQIFLYDSLIHQNIDKVLTIASYMIFWELKKVPIFPFHGALEENWRGS